MKINLIPKILLLLLLILNLNVFGQSTNIRGLYVTAFDDILGNATAENKLLNYCQGNSLNYICLYDVSGLNLTSTTVKNSFASFISRAKTQYGITQVGVAGEIYSFFSTYIIPYNKGRTLATEKVDVLNFEFEFWVSSTVSSYYCGKYLSSNGYSCNVDGAFAFALAQFQQIDNACAANGLISEVYFGWPTRTQMQKMANIADRILLHAYRPTDSDVFQYSSGRLQDVASLNKVVTIIPIFSSEPSFMGTWLKTNPITKPYSTYSSKYAAETGSWKQYINLQGYHWFYNITMPQTTSMVATITAGGSTTFCTGGSVTLSANSGSGYTYQWMKNSVNISGATGQSYVATGAGSYSVKVSGSAGSATSSAVTVTVTTSITAPTITASGPITFCVGGSVTLSCSSASGYLWSTGATTKSITVTIAGNYSVTAYTGNCSATSLPTIVVISATAITPTISANGSTSICPGSAVTLASSTSNGYLWSTGASTKTIVATAGGTYWVKAYDGPNCFAQSANTTVTLLAAPSTPVITASGSLTLSTGQSVTLSTAAATRYLWSSGETTQSLIVNYQGSYRVTVFGANGCSATSNSVIVSANGCSPPPVPSVTASGSTTLLSGQSVTLTCGASTGGYLWSNGAVTKSITVSTAGTYTVRNYNAGYCYSTSAPVIVYVITAREANALSNLTSSMAAFPNPAHDMLHISFNSNAAQRCDISFYDISGRKIVGKIANAVEGENLFDFNTDEFSRGIYFVILKGENIDAHTKVVIE